MYSQKVDLKNYYYSNYKPLEINQSSSQRANFLHNNYIKLNGDQESEDEMSFVLKYYEDFDRLNRSGSVFYGDEVSEYLNRLKDFIIDDPEKSKLINVYLLDSPYMNAFTNDLGSIYVSIASIAKLDCEEELVYMIAHEISHILLRHSHTMEKNKLNENFKFIDDEKNFKKLRNSRKHEFEADSLALNLLSNRVSTKFFFSLLNQLKNVKNPVLMNEFDIDFFIGERTIIGEKFRQLWEEQSSQKEFFPVYESEVKSTHPLTHKRIDRFLKLEMDSIVVNLEYSPIGDFDKYKNITTYLLIKSYIDNDLYLYALDLVLKLRKRDGDSQYLIEEQIKIMVLLLQWKYNQKEVDIVINGEGNECNDESFLRFRRVILILQSFDFNVLTIDIIEKLRGKLIRVSEPVEIATEKAVQKLFAMNSSLFAEDSLNNVVYTPNYQSVNLKDSIRLGVMNDDDVDIMRVMKDDEYIFIKQLDSVYFITKIFDVLPLIDRYQTYYNNYISLKKVNKLTLNENISYLNNYYKVFRKYREGEFKKTVPFDTLSNIAVLYNEYIYIETEGFNYPKINYDKSFQLEDSILKFKKGLNYMDLTCKTSLNTSVYDSYIHKQILNWMFKKLNSKPSTFLYNEYELNNYFKSKAIKYINYNICIVNKNIGPGKKYYNQYYEFFFDVELGSIVYTSKISSNLKDESKCLKSFVDLTEVNKRIISVN